MYSALTTLLITGVVLTILGGLRLALVMKGINGMRFIQIGAGLGGTAILTIVIAATKKRFESQKESTPKAFSQAPELIEPAQPGFVDAPIPTSQAEDEAAEWRELRERNQAMHIPPADFRELVEFLRKHTRFIVLEAIENGTLLDQTHLDLSFKNLRTIPSALGFLKNLKTLKISNNQIKTLPESFGSLTALTRLDLQNNQLETLPESFGGLTALTHLDLSNNKLKRLPESFGSLTALTRLDLQNNQLERLPDSFGRLTALTNLDLSNNKLKRLPESFGSLTALTYLYLNINSLETLPESFGSLTALTHLELGYNELETLSESFGGLTALTYLNLSNNELQRLPKSFSSLTALTHLYLNTNNLETLPESFGSLIALTYLYLYDNKLQRLPDSFGGLSALMNLLLWNNKLQRLPDSFGCLTALTDLNLQNNQLQRLPESFGRLTALTNLYLNDNQLVRLPNTMGHSRLGALWITNNPLLANLPLSLSNCRDLNYINIEGTSISIETRDSILRATQQARGLEGAAKLPPKLSFWKRIGKIREEWPELTDHTQKINLYEWLLRLEKAKDFGSCQDQMANITCQILTTVFNDENFRNQFFNLIAADLEACGDRAAMSLNLVYTEWRLHDLLREIAKGPKDIEQERNIELQTILPLLIGYGRTLKLREIIARDHGHKAESVERFLYAEVSLRECLGLITAVQGMHYQRCGEDVDLEAVEAEVKATTDAEYIYELTSWQNYLNEHHQKEVQTQRDMAGAELESILQDETLSEVLKLQIAGRHKDEQPRRVYLPVTQKLLANRSSWF